MLEPAQQIIVDRNLAANADAAACSRKLAATYPLLAQVLIVHGALPAGANPCQHTRGRQ